MKLSELLNKVKNFDSKSSDKSSSRLVEIEQDLLDSISGARPMTWGKSTGPGKWIKVSV